MRRGRRRVCGWRGRCCGVRTGAGAGVGAEGNTWDGWDGVGLGPSGGFGGYGASGFNEKARDDRNDNHQLRHIHIYPLFFADLRKRPSFLYAYLQEKGQLGMD